MKLHLYSVYDRIGQAYANPMILQNDGTALRAFRDEVNRPDEKSNLYMHAGDFELWHIGTMDDEQGTVETEKRLIVTGAACKENTNG